MAAQTNELAQVMESRANMYNLLAKVFITEVTADTLKELRAMQAASL